MEWNVYFTISGQLLYLYMDMWSMINGTLIKRNILILSGYIDDWWILINIRQLLYIIYG